MIPPSSSVRRQALARREQEIGGRRFLTPIRRLDELAHMEGDAARCGVHSTFLFSVAARSHWWGRSGGLQEVRKLLTLRSDSTARCTQLFKQSSLLQITSSRPLEFATAPQCPAMSCSADQGRASSHELLCASSLGALGLR